MKLFTPDSLSDLSVQFYTILYLLLASVPHVARHMDKKQQFSIGGWSDVWLSAAAADAGLVLQTVMRHASVCQTSSQSSGTLFSKEHCLL